MRLLILYWFPTTQEMRSAVTRHLHALDGRGHELVYHNSYAESPAWLRGLEFDGVILHTTFLCERWSDRFARHRGRYAWVAGLPCTKIALPQDEYDHSETLDEWLAELGVEWVFSCFDADVRPVLYPRLHDRARFLRVLTGYVDEGMAERCSSRMLAHDDRPNDIVYRAAHLPYWFGSHGQLKHRVADAVARRAAAHGLTADISTRWEDTIFGDAWSEFLMSGRAVLGVESGSSVLDRRGELQAQIRRLLTDRPGLTFDEVDRLMPPGWDAWTFFAISPRHLEAVVTKTCQVLVEGEYSGVLVPGRHYLPLRRDLSNLDDVLEKLRDRQLLRETAERAYEDVYLEGRYGYDDFAGCIEAALVSGSGHARRWRRVAYPAVRAGGAAVRMVAEPAGRAASARLRSSRARPVVQAAKRRLAAMAGRLA